MHAEDRFWLHIPLSEMNVDLWESLCDRCGLCCLHKIEDIDTGEIFYTKVACKYLDLSTCSCANYEDRSTKVEGCIWLTPEKIMQLHWMPKTCAYRRIAEGKDLLWWHPLLSGDVESVHQAGISVRGRCVSERNVNMDRLEKYVVNWFNKK